ncbi:mercury(II) reductase [Rhodothermus profundi]|uniref:Mercuric reductase n=1 Tax=Rhodothermus profundi TaxID=633813 RepID=A0A1M6ST65_9BACT|nr:mercury(II) reductase [Rhodothermus profundi]SHK47913.1 mercuric reductase [Rhodothermus profundi]
MKKILALHIKGMTCAHCARAIERALRQVAGVTRAQVVDWSHGRVMVTWKGKTVEAEALAQAIAAAGPGYRLERWEVVREIGDKTLPEGVSDRVDYDLLIIGGGSAAFAAALRARELGFRSLIVNEGLPPGGTCVNVGCVPSKALIRAAEAHYRAAHHPFAGIRSTSQVVDFGALIEQVQALTSKLRQHKYLDLIDGRQIAFRKGRARLAGPNTIQIGDEIFSGRAVLIATGARTALPPVPGLTEGPYLTHETLYRLDTLPGHLIVLGGGYIGLENAQAFARLGCQVTLLQRSARILSREDPDVSDTLAAYLQEEGVDIRTGVQLQHVSWQQDGVQVRYVQAGKTHRISGTHLLVATGRRGNTDHLGLEALGIATDPQGFLQVDETLRTTVPTVWGAGDVIGAPLFVYTAAYEGKLAAENALLHQQERRDEQNVPWVIFTDPQVAGVGLDERAAQAAGLDYETSVLPISEVPRAQVGRDARGFLKLLRDPRSDRLLGARIVAPEGGELLMGLSLALRYDIPVSELARCFCPYLTWSEAVKLAALGFTKDVRQLSCCAT